MKGEKEQKTGREGKEIMEGEKEGRERIGRREGREGNIGRDKFTSSYFFTVIFFP